MQSKNIDISQSSIQTSQQQNRHRFSFQQQQQQQQLNNIPSQQDDTSGRSEDWCSESSSGNFRPLRQLAVKGRSLVPVCKQRKFSITPSSSSVSLLASTSSKDNTNDSSNIITDRSCSTTLINGFSIESGDINKKPLIAKWKTGVRLESATSSSPSTSTDSKGNLNKIEILDIFHTSVEQD